MYLSYHCPNSVPDINSKSADCKIVHDIFLCRGIYLQLILHTYCNDSPNISNNCTVSHLSHCCHNFPWLCVWDGCTIIFCYLLHIHPGNTGTLFPLLMLSLWYLQMIGYIMACRSCSFVCRLHHLIIIIMQTYLRHWTNKMLVRYMLPSVCLRLRQFSQLSCIRYMVLCVFSLPNSPVMIARMCTLSYHPHQIGSMNH